MARKDLEQLLTLNRQGRVLSSVAQLLEWDRHTYLPPAGLEARAEQASLIVELYWEKKAGAGYRTALEKLVDVETGELLVEGLDVISQATIRECWRDYVHVTKLPQEIQQAFSQQAAECSHAYHQAKQNNRFSLFAPALEKMIELCRERAEIWGYTDHPYDALLGEHEPGLDTATVDRLIDGLVPVLTELRQVGEPIPFLQRTVGMQQLVEITHRLLHSVGLSPEKTRLDLSGQVMSCGIHPNDTRFTLALEPTQPWIQVLSVLREWGQVLYYTSLPQSLFGTPLSEPASKAIAESQSSLWEKHVGRSLPFWQFFFPQAEEVLGETLSGITAEEFYRAINVPHASPTRKGADEIAYLLHLILRYELEKDLIGGELHVDDLPDAWNAKTKEYLGFTPISDLEGCLQDIHWSIGLFGHTTIALMGEFYAAQIHASCPKYDPQNLAAHLRQTLYEHGRLYTPEELLLQSTGHPLSNEPLVSYLQNKFQAPILA